MKSIFVLIILICVSFIGAAYAERPLDPSDPVAQYNLAREYADPNNAKHDMAKALYWFEKAGHKGHIRAQKEVGDIYRYGKGVEIDTARARRWYEMPSTFIMNGIKTVGGTREDVDDMRQTSIELMVQQKKARDAQPKKEMTAYELGEAIGAIMKNTQESRAKYSDIETPKHADDLSPAVRACREEAMKYIISCAKITDTQNCEMTGCPEIIDCDDRLTKCDDHGAPYDTSETFYCDKRNWRTRDVSLENVLQATCSEQ